METTTQVFLSITLEKRGAKVVLGESRNTGYEGQIEIDDVRFNVGTKKNSLQDVEGKNVTNNLDFQTVTISKVFDRSSLLLAGVMNRRERFSEAKIWVDQQYIDEEGKKTRNDIVRLHLYNGQIVDFKLRTAEGQAGAEIKEDFELSFHNFEFVYWGYEREGARLGDDYRTKYAGFQTDRRQQES